ncbi:MAG: DNA-3-methyladenine glycosylase [Steroidobacteraceae bacterium]
MQETTIAGRASRKIEKSIERLPRTSLPSDTVELARALLGKVLVRQFSGGIVAGRIVETEAYLQNDPACHAFRGITPRNRSLFLEHGHAYVYLCYGTSYLLNVSSEPGGIGSGVLLRALEPMLGTEDMQRNVSHVKLADLTRGPGRLTAALRVNLRHDGLNLFDDKQLWIGSDGHKVASIGESIRIGLTKAAEERLRFFVQGSRYLSGPRRLND